jgi:hypothetical protein
MLMNIDGVTCSTKALAERLAGMTDKPVAFIHDSFDFTKFPKQKKVHNKGQTEIAAWHGYSENFPMLDSAVSVLAKHGIKKLLVIADRRRPYVLPAGLDGKVEIVNYPWSEETVLADLLRADIVINPQSTRARWKFKSENKTVMAWALGLPVAHNEDELKALLTSEQRKTEADIRYKQARKDYDVRDTVKEYQEFIKVCQDVSS